MQLRVSVLLALVLTACGGEEKKPEAKKVAPAAPTQLNVYIWTNYHSDAMVKRFEQENNAKVTIDTYDNNEVIEQKLQSGAAPYDIVVPTDYMITTLQKQDLLLPLDATKLPNLKHIDPQFDLLTKTGETRYSVPYLWGTTGYAYRTDKISEPLNSWKAVFDPKYKGKIVMLDDIREAFGAALRVDGKSMNTSDEAALASAKAKLIAQKKLLLAYDSSDFAGKVQAGDGWVVQGYAGELARVARESNGTIKYVVPVEGGTLATDNLAIPKASKHPDLALAFINFMMDPDVAADTTNVTGYATANLTAKPKIKPELLNDPGVYPPQEILSRCEFTLDLGDKTPVLDGMWTEIKAE